MDCVRERVCARLDFECIFKTLCLHNKFQHNSISHMWPLNFLTNFVKLTVVINGDIDSCARTDLCSFLPKIAALNLVDIYKIKNLKQTKPSAESDFHKQTNAYIRTTARTWILGKHTLIFHLLKKPIMVLLICFWDNDLTSATSAISERRNAFSDITAIFQHFHARCAWAWPYLPSAELVLHDWKCPMAFWICIRTRLTSVFIVIVCSCEYNRGV